MESRNLSRGERRRAPRAQAAFPFSLATRQDGVAPRPARLRDLSVLGLCCEVPAAVPEMTAVRVDLEIPLDGSTPQTVQADGVVVRCAPLSGSGSSEGPAGEGGPCEVAVYFTGLAPAARERIAAYVAANGRPGKQPAKPPG